MSFAPVRLGNTVLEAETASADRKSCRRFGPCGVGEKALYLNDLLVDRHFYVAFGSVRRVFKRVAMSRGGFSGKGVFGSIPYLVVQYDDGQEKQCTFKREEDVDELLAYLEQAHPEIPRLSVGGEQRLAKKAQQEAARYLKELTPQAQSEREELERARKFLSGYPELTAQLASAAKAKRINEHTNPAYRWVALAVVLAGAAAAISASTSRSSALLPCSSSRERTFCPRQRITAGQSNAPGTRRRPPWRMSCPRTSPSPPAMRIQSCSTA